MQHEFNGTGILRSVDPPASEWVVTYRFSITTIENVRIHCVTAKTDSAGSVSADNGIAIPEGYYRLMAEHGEIMRVKNLGIGHWTLIASV